MTERILSGFAVALTTTGLIESGVLRNGFWVAGIAVAFYILPAKATVLTLIAFVVWMNRIAGQIVIHVAGRPKDRKTPNRARLVIPALGDVTQGPVRDRSN